jgi:hypothetical protein
MRTLKMMFVAMMSVVLTAGFAVAEDDISIGIDNENNINITNGNASSNQNQNQTQNQDQRQKQQLIFNERTQLPHLQYGTNFVNPGVGIQNKGWFLYQSAVYAYLSAVEVENMRRHFQFSDIFFWNWKSRMNISMVNERLEGQPEGISLMNYWPMTVANKGDKVITSITVRGDVNWPEESFLGMAAQVCLEEAGSDRFAVMYTIASKGITNGASISIGGAMSQTYNSGNKGAVVTSGGQLGTIESSVEDYKQFEVKCMNRGEINLIDYRPRVTPPVVAPPAPQPPAACNPDTFIAQIKAYIYEIVWCKFPCFNNQTLRFGKANAYMDQYFCEGRRNKQLLLNAIYEYGVAERDFNNGRELTRTQKFGDKPKGVRTTTMSEARDLDYKVHYNWALAIRELNGEGAEVDHAHKYGLGNKGSQDMPAVWADMKR